MTPQMDVWSPSYDHISRERGPWTAAVYFSTKIAESGQDKQFSYTATALCVAFGKSSRRTSSRLCSLRSEACVKKSKQTTQDIVLQGVRPSAWVLIGRTAYTVLQDMRPSARKLNGRTPDTVLGLHCKQLIRREAKPHESARLRPSVINWHGQPPVFIQASPLATAFSLHAQTSRAHPPTPRILSHTTARHAAGLTPQHRFSQPAAKYLTIIVSNLYTKL